MAALALLAIAVPARGQEPPPVAYESYMLDNGLRVILAPSRTTQVVAVDVTYRVGSADESRGRTGFAHLFEHMMFQGSAHVPKGGHFQLVGDAGGITNAFTTEDRTEYFQVLPSNLLARGLWLEADRMRSLAVTDENFENQRSTVLEEFRLNVENQPFVPTLLRAVYSLADSADCFGYAHSTFGSMDDLRRATADEARAFFRTWYHPGNATLVVAGDFEAAEAKALIARYFGGIPAGQAATRTNCRQRFDSGASAVRVASERAPLIAVFLAFRVPAYAHTDYPALLLLTDILGGSAGSRLKQTLMRQQALAVNAGAQMGVIVSGATGRPSPRTGMSVLLTNALANQGVVADTAEKALFEQVLLIVRDGVTEAELATAKQQQRARIIRDRQSPIFIAEDLQLAALFHGDPGAVNTELQRILAVTTADVQRVAKQYLKVENSMMITLVPVAR